ncbi:MAG: LamG domain-containing protein, partial [Nanoarchaeota archaeon]|nr:LamG domain-containing protein [Nanoarchaeota archaeon]
MVHKKYIKQGKRKYGPYLYETKRVNGRVITTYIGKVNEKKRKFAFYYLFLGLLLVLLLLFLFFPVSFTGYVISDNSEVKDTADLEAIRESKSIEKAKIQNKVVKVVGVIDSTETTQYDAILGKPVKWRKNVKLSSPGIVSIAIPLSAVNISIVKIIRVNKTIAQAGNRNINATSNKPDKITNKSSVIIAKNKSEQDADEHDFTDAQEEVVIGDTDVQEEVLIEEEEIKEKTEEKSEEESESEEFDENIVSELGNLIINNVFVSFFNRFVRFTGLTIIGDEIVVKQDKQIIEINEIVEEVEIEYYTDAPYVVEEAIENGKRVQIIGPEDVHYENVLAFTKLSESLNVRNPSQVKIYWVENNTYISHLNIIDNNKNGIYDYIEWIAPFLSNQTFNIIVITKAEHLDENRTFISDVFKEVRELDGIWSETIPNTHYVRVTFEINLTSDRDITLYPRTVSGTPRIEVYEINGNKLIAEFTSLIDNQYNKVFLTNLQGSQDTFDLLILDGDIEFDHIIDPTAEFFEDCISLSVAPGTWTLTGGATQWFAGGGGGDAGNCNAKNVDFNTNMTSATLNLGGGKTANLSYDWETSGLDSSTNEHFSVWIDNGTTVVELFNQQPDATGTNVHVLQDNITLTSTVTIIGECRNDANNERCRWDNINVTSYPAVDNEFPIFSSFTEVPANNTAYVSGATYRFNATITSTNGTAGIEFDGVNYTANNVTSDVYNVSVTDLAAGSYEYYWWSFGNGSSNNYNASGTRGYTVAKATGDVEVYLDGNTANITVELGSTVTYNASVLTGEITTEVYEDGTLVANGTATTNTTVTNSVGSINITAILVESQNYTSDDQTRFIDVQDTTPPDVNITFPESVIYGNKDIPLNFNVTLNENGSVMYSLDGGINNITMYNGTNIIGRYFNATNNSIADGDYTFTAYANDTAGNQNNTESVTFSFDGTVPLLAIDSPQSITYSVSRIEFNITLSEEGNASWFTLDGGTVNYTMTKYNTTVFNYTNASVPDGTYTAQFYANDSAGNINDTESVTFSVDTTPPTVNFTNPTPANGSTQTNTDIFVNVSSNDSGDHYTFVDFDNDLVLWMRMDDVNSSGDPTDLSSYSNNGTLVGNAKINSSGYFGNASWFDGEGDYINTGVWNLSDKFSVSLWFNRKDLDTSNHVGVFTKHNHFLIRFAQTSGNFQSFIGTGSGFASGNIDAGTLNDDQWYHSVITWDGSTLQLYLNGTFDSSAAVSGSIGGNGNSFQIGLWRDSFNEYFNGSIDEVLVFNRSLSSDEISALYNASTNQYFNNFTGLAADTNHTFTGYAVDIYGNKNQTEERVVMISAVATGKNNWISGSLQPFDNATAWSLGTVPVTGDNVVFNATGTGDVNITNNTMPQDLNSFLVESGYTGTISFQGLFAVGNWTEGNTGTQFWNVTNNITIANGTMKIYGDYPYNITNEGHGQVWNSTSGNITIGSEATLDGVGLGFPVGVGPGTGSSTQSSAHGGRGESYKYYGNFSAPTALGSGGGDAGEGGSGIKLSATSGIILIDGNIFMNGSVGGGRRGSGGSIWLRADNITGTGIVSAVGGRSTGVSRSSGGGGRIRFDFNKYGFTGTIDAESPTPP